jgi:pimeloyl-ACP methyl ester carboxylesterase
VSEHPLPSPEPWAHHRVSLGDVSLHYVEAGAGRPVLFLHGFPEFWYSWRHQLVAAANANLRALAPDLRGYNESDKPVGIESYRLDVLTEDAAEMIRRLAGGRAAVVGHDWGGVIAFQLAMRFPELVERLVVLNAPHPAAFRRELRTLGQMLRSWYIFFFQLPVLPEWLLARNNYAFLRRALAPCFTAEEIEHYRQALAQPGARTATVNYYRANWRHRIDSASRPITITAPALLIWGERDRYLGPRLTEGLEPWFSNLRVKRLPDVGHWIQNEAPDRVNRLLIDFLTLHLRDRVDRE